ncbi:MAG: ferrous iron transport protein B [Chloroflexi bacterium RBG_16_57_11]|nr:MAG: ferrous iron transport protein B [Chloroflexi bacterium RBG_16_57_11]
MVAGGKIAGGNFTAGSIALVGHPNVGKSVIFQRLTGQRVIVSNYPGTTVEVARGSAPRLPGLTLIDTPGVIAFPPYSEDEQVTARLLLNEPIQIILQVGDAKNLRRTLLLTLQLAEMGLPLVLALNMTDEALARGVALDYGRISAAIGAPVIPTTAIHGQGVDQLTEAVRSASPCSFHIQYPPEVEAALAEFDAHVRSSSDRLGSIQPRALGLLWLSGDTVVAEWLRLHLDAAQYTQLQAQRDAAQAGSATSLARHIQQARLELVDRLADASLLSAGESGRGWNARLSALTTHPIWGWGFLAIILYAIYWFVGVFGAGILVGLLEQGLFGQVINPWVTGLVQGVVAIPWLEELLVGPYGLWTMGLTYALALILPIVTTFFLAFGVLEDSGYLPRLAALSNRLFKALGLNGKAVLPMVLGLGCVTMAMLTTRVLESKRDRLLVTLLLALAVPCSAQLGVVMGMLAGISFGATLIWGGVIFIVLLAVGWLAARLTPGERTMLVVELPPLRLPQASNVLIKTLARLEWYIKEVVPLFLLGAGLMFLLDKSGLLAWLVSVGEPLMTGWLGLPAEASAAFVMGFLRRDFGATGLFVMASHGQLNELQVLVAMVTVTLFIPCIASVMMIAKERGSRTALGMVVLIIPLAFLVGGILNRLLLALVWGV